MKCPQFFSLYQGIFLQGYLSEKHIIGLRVIFFIAAQDKNTFTSAQSEKLSQNFVRTIDARQQADTKIEDIDHYISLLADYFIDEHIKYI